MVTAKLNLTNRIYYNSYYNRSISSNLEVFLIISRSPLHTRLICIYKINGANEQMIGITYINYTLFLNFIVIHLKLYYALWFTFIIICYFNYI